MGWFDFKIEWKKLLTNRFKWLVTWISFFIGISLIGKPLAEWLMTRNYNVWAIGIFFILLAGFLELREEED